MPRFPRLQTSFVLLFVWESACQRKQPAVPLPPPPGAVQTAPAPPSPASVNSPPPPNPPTTTHAEEQTQYQVNKAQTAPAAKKPTHSATTIAPSPTAASASQEPASPAAPPAPPPRLGDILTADEQRQYSAAIDKSLSHAQTSLSSISARHLSKDQQAQAEQVRNFLQQAQATRGSDPAGAKSLAERAEVLARDLAASFR